MRGMMLGLFLALSPCAASGATLFMTTGAEVYPPRGWIKFCAGQPVDECAGVPIRNKDEAEASWKDVEFVNEWVNRHIKPLSDLRHWSGGDLRNAFVERDPSGNVVDIDKWSYPDDGFGDCEDYVLLKRRMLMQAGWPREDLLITVVTDKQGEGHAVLTVETDQGDLVLDNQIDEILPWSKAGYGYVKRQSERDPNVWVEIKPPPREFAASVPAVPYLEWPGNWLAQH